MERGKEGFRQPSGRPFDPPGTAFSAGVTADPGDREMWPERAPLRLVQAGFLEPLGEARLQPAGGFGFRPESKQARLPLGDRGRLGLERQLDWPGEIWPKGRCGGLDLALWTGAQEAESAVERMRSDRSECGIA